MLLILSNPAPYIQWGALGLAGAIDLACNFLHAVLNNLTHFYQFFDDLQYCTTFKK
jgi:hypothetical protein